jgi:hypothetical protein
MRQVILTTLFGIDQIRVIGIASVHASYHAKDPNR